MSDVITITPEAILTEIQQNRRYFIRILREMKRNCEMGAAKTRVIGSFEGRVGAMQRIAAMCDANDLIRQLDEERSLFTETVAHEELFI